jgi:hypothetical protein
MDASVGVRITGVRVRVTHGLAWRGSLGNEQEQVEAYVQRLSGPLDLPMQSEQRFGVTIHCEVWDLPGHRLQVIGDRANVVKPGDWIGILGAQHAFCDARVAEIRNLLDHWTLRAAPVGGLTFCRAAAMSCKASTSRRRCSSLRE